MYFFVFCFRTHLSVVDAQSATCVWQPVFLLRGTRNLLTFERKVSGKLRGQMSTALFFD